MKHNKGNGNIIEKKAIDQDIVMSEKEETECQIGQNHDGIWRFEQCFTKNSQKTAKKQQYGTSLAFYMLIRTSGAGCE